MKTYDINGEVFKSLILNGHQNLAKDFEVINALNVFPVPDGDTGTNMRMTMEGGVKAIANSTSTHVGLVAKDMARGMTYSARGNSGVILSQFFKGLAISLLEKEIINTFDFATAMQCGVKQAYDVVKNPTEGTILTVMREACQKAYESKVETFEEYFQVLLKEANASLKRTPDLLPVLKKAGVIDSGGAGYIKVLEGMALAIDGEMLDSIEFETDAVGSADLSSFNADSELEFGYCTEFILQLQNSKVDVKNFDLKLITDFLESIGNSIVAFKDDDIVKVHVHTFTPGEVITYCQKFGEYVTFKMENMSVQHSEGTVLEQQTEKEFKETTIVAVSSGDGITNLFTEMGVDCVVTGGQTMNPSTNDFINAFDSLNTANIVVFPNNSNIIMAAKQAAEQYTKANVVVIETKSIAQCYSALSLMCEESLDSMLTVIDEAISNVISYEVTYAVRDSQIDNFEIKKDDYLGFKDHNLTSVKKTKLDTIKSLLENTSEVDEKGVFTILYGKDVSLDELEEIEAFVNKNYPWIEVGSIYGGQDVYSFIICLD